MNPKIGALMAPAAEAQPGSLRSALALAAARTWGFFKGTSGSPVREEAPDPLAGATIEEILGHIEGEKLTFTNVTSRYGNIDYVVLSRQQGLFLIETKAHSGRVSVVESRLRVNGRLPEKDFVGQTLRNTYWLIEEIRSATGKEAAITPVLVFTHASVDSGRPLKGIPITNKSSLLATIAREGQPMSEPLWEAREAIAAILEGKPVAVAH